MKKTTPSNTGMYIEISILVLFFIIMLAPIFMVIHSHNSHSQPNTTEESSTQEKNTTDAEHDTTPKEPTPTTAPAEPQSTPTEQTSPESTPAKPTPAPSTTSESNSQAPSCYHEEYGICWDELEENNYSAGLYDHEYGYYGASVIYPDSCDSVCRDIIDDAYEEGWYDGDAY